MTSVACCLAAPQHGSIAPSRPRQSWPLTSTADWAPPCSLGASPRCLAKHAGFFVLGHPGAARELSQQRGRLLLALAAEGDVAGVRQLHTAAGVPLSFTDQRGVAAC